MKSLIFSFLILTAPIFAIAQGSSVEPIEALGLQYELGYDYLVEVEDGVDKIFRDPDAGTLLAISRANEEAYPEAEGLYCKNREALKITNDQGFIGYVVSVQGCETSTSGEDLRQTTVVYLNESAEVSVVFRSSWVNY